MTEQDRIDERLGRLRDATERALPRADFAARVMSAVSGEKVEIGWWTDLPRAARRLVPVAVLAAAVAAALATTSTIAFDDALTGTDDNGVEIEW